MGNFGFVAFPKGYPVFSLSRCVHSGAEAKVFLREEALDAAIHGASSVLVQVFWNAAACGDLHEVVETVHSALPNAVMVGADSAGNISDGAVFLEGIVLAVSCFSGACLLASFFRPDSGNALEAGQRLVERLASPGKLRAILLLATPNDIDIEAIVSTLNDALPSVLVFGGVAIGRAGGLGRPSGILFGQNVASQGMAAIGFYGDELHIEIRSLFDWRPLGPALMLTEVDGRRIRKIDGKPAFELYREKLDVRDDEDISLLEFPLLFEREGILLARNPLSVDSDGSVLISSEARLGELAHLGFLEIRALKDSIVSALSSLSAFQPEAIFLYSCVCRLYTLLGDVKVETSPFQGLAATAGFFTSGEFLVSSGKLRLQNSSEVIVAIREGARGREGEVGKIPVLPQIESIRERHSRVTSQLFRLSEALIDNLGLEIAERKRAEEEAQASAREKEKLFRELQHRVKNSMNMVSSIAYIEASQSETAEAKEALQKLQLRIGALASLYEILYDSGSIEEIDLAAYLGSIADYSAMSLGADVRKIAIRKDLESVRLDVGRAISIGLMSNELITNCLKYAFPGREGGEIYIRLTLEDGILVLWIKDNGVGMAGAREGKHGFGTTLLHSLATDLDGQISYREVEVGTHFELRLRL
jgi:two-component sensor histidine kinase